MNSIYNGNITLSIFGESHGEAVGIVIDGLPPGMELDMESIREEMDRRKPGTSKLATPRQEDDQVQLISGFFEGRTTGAPLCGIIFSKDTKSKDYSELKVKMRPGHSDYSGAVHYRGFNDYRGGGHFSGRLTAPLVFAGAVAKEYLKNYGVEIGAHLKQVHSVEDISFNDLDKHIKTIVYQELLQSLRGMRVPVLRASVGEEIEKVIIDAKSEGDSVGAIIECMAVGVKAGLGSPFFNSLESKIASLAFSVPGVKGISFGAGFGFADMKGSEANDPYFIEEGVVSLKSNNNGGIIGGISVGSPIVFSVVMKPTPSISKKQETINIETNENTELEIVGRHDACIAIRGIPVIEGILAIALLDAYLEDKKWD
ncbi:MAG: chorismate synthase [Firmicutes bacterium]|nr:chorismate synthase [Bacillota bacterium]